MFWVAVLEGVRGLLCRHQSSLSNKSSEGITAQKAAKLHMRIVQLYSERQANACGQVLCRRRKRAMINTLWRATHSSSIGRFAQLRQEPSNCIHFLQRCSRCRDHHCPNPTLPVHHKQSSVCSTQHNILQHHKTNLSPLRGVAPKNHASKGLES